MTSPEDLRSLFSELSNLKFNSEKKMDFLLKCPDLLFANYTYDFIHKVNYFRKHWQMKDSTIRNLLEQYPFLALK